MRYRILIQNRDDGDKHIAHVSIESSDIDKVVIKIKSVLSKEITNRQKLFAEFLARKKKDFVQELIDEIPSDLIDWGSKGNDISKKEFLENELYFALRE